MTYEELIQYNKRNLSNKVDKFRVEKVLNDKKTCQLKAISRNVNPIIIDIVHVVAEVKLGRMTLTNPSTIKNWKYFNIKGQG